MRKSCGKLLGENLAGNCGGKFLRDNPCMKLLQNNLEEGKLKPI